MIKVSIILQEACCPTPSRTGSGSTVQGTGGWTRRAGKCCAKAVHADICEFPLLSRSGCHRLTQRGFTLLGLLVLCTECLLSEQVGDTLDKDLGNGCSGCIPDSSEKSSSVCQHMQPVSTKLALSRMSVKNASLQLR